MVESRHRLLYAIALFEGIKGVAAIAASLGLLSLAHRNVRSAAYALIGHFHLDPEAHFPRLLLNYATLLGNQGVRNAVLLAWGYAALRLLEGYGLWRDRAWAEWLAALSGAVYMPWEALHLAGQPSALNALVLLGNAAVVAYMVWRLRLRRRGAGDAALQEARNKARNAARN